MRVANELSRLPRTIVSGLAMLVLAAPLSFAQNKPSAPADDRGRPQTANSQAVPPVGATAAPTAAASAPAANHPLLNMVWDVKANAAITVGELVKRLAAAEAILLGERHGHVAHQSRAAFLIAALADRERYPALALEMLEPRQAIIVDRYRREEPEYSGRLGAALQWWDTGWPSWVFYEPIFSAAFTAKLPLIAADLPRAEQDRIERSSTDTPPDAAIYTSWKASMKAAHCNLIEEDRLSRVATLQWRRDQAMADAVREGVANAGSVILLAGREHVRRDRGIARHLSDGDVAGKPTLATVVVALMDVDPAKLTAGVGYVPDTIAASAGQVYDYLWFTPGTRATDVCKVDAR
jgi:uncharacterized iron-regulated protein